MVRRFDLGFRRNRDRALTAARATLMVGLLAGCSSVPDAVNPVEWYKGASDLVTGRDRSDVAAPAPPKGQFPEVNKSAAADNRKDLTKGLPADRGNSKYAEPVRREVAPTKALARRTPAPAAPQVAAAPAPVVAAAAPTVVMSSKQAVAKQDLPPALSQTPTAPQIAQAETPRLSPDRRAATVRDSGPDAPPAAMNMAPPAPADIPVTVAAPARGKLKPVQEQFQRRLAESAQQTVSAGMVEMPQPALANAGPAYGSFARNTEDEPIHLVPPSSHRAVKGGGKGLAAPKPVPQVAASFQIASVDFRTNSAELTSADRQAIAEVAQVFKQTGGIVRVVGHAASPAFGRGDAVQQVMGGLDASMKRANAVAMELSRRGVPGSKIMVGADPSAGESGAQVFLDVI